MKNAYSSVAVRSVAIVVIAAILLLAAWRFYSPPLADDWNEEQLSLIRSLSLSQLPELPADPSNAVADNEAAANFGHRFFFDTRFSSNNAVACATCHVPELMFADGLELAAGVSVGPRHTPSLVGLSYSPWFYWDGRKDSQWSQALAPLEAGVEHDSDRVEISRLIASDENYVQLYEAVFGPFPDLDSLRLPQSASPLVNQSRQQAWSAMSPNSQKIITRIFSNIGKALAAYQRKIVPGPARFDEYVEQLENSSATRQADLLSDSEIAGLNLFIDQAQCISCHNGPLLTNHDFHNTGVLAISGQLPPMGRYDGIRTARNDPLNCLGEFSDASPSQCMELRFARDENDLVGAQKTPTLRNVSLSAPYMHGGQLQTLDDVMVHYNEAPTSMLNHNEAKPLGLRSNQLRQLRDFVLTLTAPLATEDKWLKPPTDETSN